MQELRSELLSSSSPSPSSASQGCGGWQLVPLGNLCPLQEGSLRRRARGEQVSGYLKNWPMHVEQPSWRSLFPSRRICRTNPLPCILLFWGRWPRSPQEQQSVTPSPQGLWPAGGWCSRAPVSQALGCKQGRARYSLGVAGSTGEEHWDCAAARHPHVRQDQLTRAQAAQLRDREARAQPIASFLKIQLRTRLALHTES